MDADKNSTKEKRMSRFFLYTTAVALMATYINDCSNNSRMPVKRNDTFSGKDYKGLLVETSAKDFDKDGSIDAIMGLYDLNRNGEPDATAVYIMEIKPPLRYPTLVPNAVMVFINADEDSELDYLLIDMDKNGTLESIVKPRQLQDKKPAEAEAKPEYKI